MIYLGSWGVDVGYVRVLLSEKDGCYGGSNDPELVMTPSRPSDTSSIHPIWAGGLLMDYIQLHVPEDSLTPHLYARGLCAPQKGLVTPLTHRPWTSC